MVDLLKIVCFYATHSFFLFNFDVKRNKRIGGAEEKKKNTIPAECLVIGSADEKSIAGTLPSLA